MKRLCILCVACAFAIGAAGQAIGAESPTGRRGYVAGVAEKSVSLGPTATRATSSPVRQPRTSTAAVGRAPNPSRPSTPSRAVATPRAATAPPRQPAAGAAIGRALPAVMNDVARAIASNAAAAAPRANGLPNRSAPVGRDPRGASAPLRGRLASERLVGRTRNRDASPEDDATYESSDAEDDSQSAGGAAGANASTASDEASQPTSSPPATPPGESLADQLAKEYFRETLRLFPYVDPSDLFAQRSRAAEMPPSQGGPPASDAGAEKPSPTTTGDRLIGDTVRRVLDYRERHNLNRQQFGRQVLALNLNESGRVPTLEEWQQKVLKVTLDYYSRELRELDALDRDAIGLSDYINDLKKQRRTEIERWLLEIGAMHRAPLKK